MKKTDATSLIKRHIFNTNRHQLSTSCSIQMLSWFLTHSGSFHWSLKIPQAQLGQNAKVETDLSKIRSFYVIILKILQEFQDFYVTHDKITICQIFSETIAEFPHKLSTIQHGLKSARQTAQAIFFDGNGWGLRSCKRCVRSVSAG